MDRPPLMKHQYGDIDWWLRDADLRGLLANEPGVGKTRSAIEATQDFRNILVVAPAMVIAGGVWQRELDKWARDPRCYTLVPYTGIPERKVNAARTATKTTNRPKPELLQDWDVMILDESHYIKNRDTTWTQALMRLRKNVPFVLPMTGTPIPNWSHEIFTTLQMIFADETAPGKRFGSYWRWAGEWFDTSPSRFSHGKPSIGGMLACTPSCRIRDPRDPCDHYIKFVAANFGKHYRRVWRSSVLDLPPVTYQVVNTPMTDTQRKAYEQLRREFVAEMGDGKKAIAWTQGDLNVMLDKITTSHTLVTGPIHGNAKLGTKLLQLEDDLRQRSRATFVVAHYKDTVEACHQIAVGLGLRSAYVHGGVRTRLAGEHIRRFQNGELDVLVGSMETVAEGQQMTEADMCIIVESSWKQYRNEQVRFRVDRLGQTRPVTIREYVTPRSVDERKRKIVLNKTEDQIRFMTAADFNRLL